MQEVIDKEMKVMEQNDIIEPSTSDWASPVVLVRKKNNTWRFTVDYSHLNKVTENLMHPLIRFDEVVDSIGQAQPSIFSVLDLCSGFWQIPLDPETKHKTAFVTRNGVYQFKRLPFGLKNAPMAFSMVMSKVLQGINWKYSLTYIDDTVVFSSSFEEHLEHLSSIFDRLTQANLKLQPQKCRFALPKVSYLGHQISSKGIEPDPQKVSSVKEFPTPKNKKELQSFLGLVNYYRRFILGFSHVAIPLNKLLKKDQPFQWTDQCQSAFCALKEKLLTVPILAYPNFSKEFILYADASDHAIGYILGQLNDNNKEVVISYGGRSMNSCERNYGISDKEGLALVSAVKYFEPYLRSNKFTVYTDHLALKGLQTLSKQTGRRQRWSDYLQGFQFEIKHKPGRIHGNADSLSRRTYPDSANTVEPEPNLFPLVSTIEDNIPPNNPEVVEYNLSYTNTIVVNQLNNGPTKPSPLTALFSSEAHYASISSLNLLQNLTENPPSDVRLLQLNDPELGPIIRFLEDQQLPEDERLAVEIRRTAPDYQIIDGVLHFNYAPKGKGPRADRVVKQLMVPHVLRDDLLKSYHDSPIGCHQGMTRTYERMKQKYWWHTMSKDTIKYVESCEVCQRAKRNFSHHNAPLQPLPIVERFGRIHMDFLGPLPTTSEGHKYILLVVDSFTRWCECFPLVSADAVSVARILFDQIICRFGAPQSILTDRGQQFMSSLIKELCRLFQIVKINTSAYHPQTNSACERMNSFILQSLRTLCNKDQSNWHDKLQAIMLAYRTTPASRSIKHTPFMLMYGQECRLPIDIALSAPSDSPSQINEHLQKIVDNLHTYSECAKKSIEQSQGVSKEYYDKNSRKPSFTTGNRVFLSNHATKKGLSPKLTDKWLGPFYIVDTRSNNTYLLRDCDTHKLRRGYVHANRLKMHVDPCERQTNPILPPPSVTVDDEIIISQESQTSESQAKQTQDNPLIIEKIYRCSTDKDGLRWYQAKVKDIGRRFVSENLVPQRMREEYHIKKTMRGKTKKRQDRKV